MLHSRCRSRTVGFHHPNNSDLLIASMCSFSNLDCPGSLARQELSQQMAQQLQNRNRTRLRELVLFWARGVEVVTGLFA